MKIAAIRRPDGIYVAHIEQDEDPRNPAEEPYMGWNLVCCHDRFGFGTHNFSSRMGELDLHLCDNVLRPLKQYAKIERIRKDVANSVYINPLAIDSHFGKFGIFKPVWMTDHSIQTLHLSRPGDRWDSGLLGIVYITNEALRTVYPSQHRRRLRAVETLEDFIKMMNLYLLNDVWRFKMQGPVRDLEELPISEEGLAGEELVNLLEQHGKDPRIRFYIYLHDADVSYSNIYGGELEDMQRCLVHHYHGNVDPQKWRLLELAYNAES